MLANVAFYSEQLCPISWANQTREKFGKIGIYNRNDLTEAIDYKTLNHRLMNANLSTMHNNTIKIMVEAMHNEIPDDMNLTQHRNWGFQSGGW